MTHHILLVDDERSTSNLIKLYLEMDGFQVIVAPTLEQAQAALNASPTPHALIVDRNLGGGKNGVDLLRAIRAGETAVSSETKVIVTSGDDRKEVEAIEAGATLFILKPFSPAELSETLSELLG